MGFIYKVTNKENGKVYIGLTTHTVEWRWRGHLYGAFNELAQKRCHFHNAIRKYGIDAFTVEAIEEVPEKELPEREKYWIAFYDSFNNGYNSNEGGTSWRKYSDKEIKGLWDEGYSCTDIAQILGTGRGTIITRLHGLKVDEEEIRKRSLDTIARKCGHPVYEYDIDGNFVKSYISLLGASKATGINKSQISAVVDGKAYQAHGKRWSKKKVDKLPPIPDKSRYRAVIGKFDKDGKIVEAYVSTEAAAKNNQTSRYSIIKAITNEKLWRNCYWRTISTEGGVIRFKEIEDEINEQSL